MTEISYEQRALKVRWPVQVGALLFNRRAVTTDRKKGKKKGKHARSEELANNVSQSDSMQDYLRTVCQLEFLHGNV
jgi:hypothetical protein